MNGSNYIKINRSILNWEWYLDNNTKVLFLHMMLKANWKKAKFKGVDIDRGSFASSYQSLSSETGLSIQNIRTSIRKLKSTGEITVTKYSKFTVFTVNNYCEYQKSNKVSNAELTGNQQATNSQVTTIEEDKFVLQNNFQKVFEGNYSNRNPQRRIYAKDLNNFERRHYDMDKLEIQLMEGQFDE